MPLAGIEGDGEPDFRRQAVGFWMFVEPIEVRPFRPVRIYVTFEALTHIDPSQSINSLTALEVFRNNRTAIEAAASAKFDASGVDEGEFGGKPTVTVLPEDLASIK
jgi:hypothetical protein